MDGGGKQEMAARISKNKEHHSHHEQQDSKTQQSLKNFSKLFITFLQKTPPRWSVQIRGADCPATGGT